MRKRAVPTVSEEDAAAVILSAGRQVTSGELHSDSRFTVSTHSDISVLNTSTAGWTDAVYFTEYNLVPNRSVEAARWFNEHANAHELACHPMLVS